MTFDQIVADICGRLNLVSDEAIARVGQAVNRHYRRVTASIGLEPVRYITRTAQTQLDSDRVTFTGIEKIDRVFEKAPDGRVLVLAPVLLAQIREGREAQGSRQRYAIWQQDATSITILLPGLALAITDLYADGWTVLADLVGADEPGIPSSFHDILIFSVVAEEQMRKEKPQLADRFSLQAETLLKELRFTLADAPAVELRQGDHVIDSAGGGGTGGAGSSVITGDIVFDRDPAPPFDVTAGSGMVENLDADKLDGQHGSFYQNASNLNAGTVPPAQIGPDSIGFDKLTNLNAGKLLGRGGSAGPGDPEEINVGSGLAMVGMSLSALPQPPAAHGTTHNAGGMDPVTSLSADILTTGTVPAARIGDNSITYDKLADLPIVSLLGRALTAGDPQRISIGPGLAMSAGAQLSALGGVPGPHFVSHEPGGIDALTRLDAGILTEGTLPAARIADHSVTLPKLATQTQNHLLGRGNDGTGDVELITLGTGLSMVGTTLNAAGGSGGTGSPGGTDQMVQFNDAGAFGGDAGLTFNKVTKQVTAVGPVRIQRDYAQVQLVHPSAPVDQRAWSVATDGLSLQMQTVDDAGGFVAAPLTVDRAGTVATNILRVDGGLLALGTNAAEGAGLGAIIRRTTPDGADNGYIILGGGGAAADTQRGGRVVVFGNEAGGAPGMVSFYPGDVPGSGVRILDSLGTVALEFQNSTKMLVFTRPANKLGAAATWDGATASLTWDLATGSAFRDPAAGSFTARWINPPPAGVEFVFSMEIFWQSGPYLVTWPANVTWDEDVVPVTPGAGRTSVFGFSTVDGGVRWRGYVGGRNFAT